MNGVLPQSREPRRVALRIDMKLVYAPVNEKS